jgi:hypothetical protein
MQALLPVPPASPAPKKTFRIVLSIGWVGHETKGLEAVTVEQGDTTSAFFQVTHGGVEVLQTLSLDDAQKCYDGLMQWPPLKFFEVMPVRTEEEQDARLDKVRRIRNKVNAMNEGRARRANSVRPKEGTGLTLTSYSSVFWAGKHLRDHDARQLKELTEAELDELLRALENDEYEVANA